MKLSEYIKRLQKIAREQKKLGNDPEVLQTRYSDFAEVGDEYPCVVEAVREQEWWTHYHRSMHPDIPVKQCVLVAEGN